MSRQRSFAEADQGFSAFMSGWATGLPEGRDAVRPLAVVLLTVSLDCMALFGRGNWRRGMRRIETSVVIERPVEQGFAYVIEPSNMPDCAPGYLEGSSTSEGPIKGGSTSRRVTDVGGRKSESRHIVTGFRPNSVIALTTKTGPLEIQESFQGEASEGGTRVTIAEEVSAPLLLKPAEWLFALAARRIIPKFSKAGKDKPEEAQQHGAFGLGRAVQPPARAKTDSARIRARCSPLGCVGPPVLSME